MRQEITSALEGTKEMKTRVLVPKYLYSSFLLIEYYNIRRSHTSLLHDVVLHGRDYVEDIALSEVELDDV